MIICGTEKNGMIEFLFVEWNDWLSGIKTDIINEIMNYMYWCTKKWITCIDDGFNSFPEQKNNFYKGFNFFLFHSKIEYQK